ncbi:hypothetical protein FHU13_003753 [Methylobacterium sp. R2-1]|nr:hypothetical protein [Methylobacterium sp. R2-1]
MGDLLNLDRALTPSGRSRLRGGTHAKRYAALLGTGPESETRSTCEHLVWKHLSKVYRKCELMRPYWKGEKGTGVLASAPACRNWKPLSDPRMAGDAK